MVSSVTRTSSIGLRRTTGRLLNHTKLTFQRGLELRSAYRNGNIRKEMTVVQNAKTDGLTVLDNLNDLGISHVDTIKIGKVIQ